MNNSINKERTEELKKLAEKYETADFSDGDPSFILKRYTQTVDVECSAFIAAILSFGRRDQFIPKIQAIFDEADRHGGPEKWLVSGAYKSFPAAVCGSPDTHDKATGPCSVASVSPGAGTNSANDKPISPSEKKFYRFYSYRDMLDLFERLQCILMQYGSLGKCIRIGYESFSSEEACKSKTGKRKIGACSSILVRAPERLLFTLEDTFSSCRAVPGGKASAAKRLCMFLRWMVRQDSPVDTGLWRWFPQKDLIIPLDTHVLQESIRMGLLPEKSTASLKTALLLTEKLKEIWPDDPCRGDFALFGLGVER
ncbi:MAG: TIGR02757 family protein [Treponemataceae bacterium]|nr:TIGR02757 family protein [Treponemataceae bacterium]